MLESPKHYAYSVTIYDSVLLIQQRLHAVQSGSRLSEARLLFERFAIMSGGFEILLPRFVNPAEVKMRKRVRLVTRRIERPLEPAHAAVGIALGQQITANIVVRISERLVDANRFQTLFDRLVVAILKTINPAKKRVRFGGRIGFDRALVKLDRCS